MHNKLVLSIQSKTISSKKSKAIFRLLIVFLLGFSSGLPYCLIGSTLQAWFATDGQTIFATASLSLLGFPYIFRFLWAPLLDRFSISALGRRRTWILMTQIGLILGFFGMSFFSPRSFPVLFISIAFLLAILSATQDGAIDSQRIEYLPDNYHPLGAALSSTAYRLGILLSGGYALIMAESFGWGFTYRTMAMFMLVGIVATIISQEPNSTSTSAHGGLHKSYKETLGSIFAIHGIFIILGFIFFYKLGEVFTSGISGIVMPFLINELKFSLSTIGYINKVLGTLALIFGGVAAGFAALRYSLLSLLMVFGLLQALTNCIFVILAWSGPSIFWFSTAVISDNFATGMGSTALVALLMRVVDRNFTATQFSLLVAFATLPRILSGPLGAWMQYYLGWAGMFQASVVLALIFIPFWLKMRPYIMTKASR